MFKKMNAFIESRNKNEDGASEFINALVILPVLIILVFSVFNVGSYFVAMSQVSDVAKEMTRKVAIYGGDDSELTRANNSGEKLSTTLKNALWQNGKCTYSACTQAPTVTCTKYSGAGLQLKPGDTVNCSVTYFFKSRLSGADFGISSFMEPEGGKQIIQYSVAETWGWPASGRLN